MAKATYACVECGYRTPKPLGRCPSCGSWESFQEVEEGGVGISVVDEHRTILGSIIIQTRGNCYCSGSSRKTG